ncbi:WD-repeat-containing protein [Boletus reticuloceps]|uniref:WD-repeat-containing protein n=1 Tax=Boletus reticuloceps TaxID=495285 RepID=A0A8I3ADX6_9AGAM|nr:WD-repeat-containing protein [Boletus reticuloceps]
MVQSYLRHGPTQAFGLICSISSNSLYDGKLAYVPALEDVLVWDMKKGHMLAMWHETGHRAEVTCIQRSPQQNVFAVGYADGSVRLWDSTLGSVRATFNGHRKAVTALAFDTQGVKLASGSQDTDLIVWDLVADVDHWHLFFALLDQPSTSTGSSNGFLLSTSKDTLLKLWDLSTQHCVQTIVAHRSEVWSMDLSPQQNLIFTGSGEGDLKAWKIDYDAVAAGLKTTESGEIGKMIQAVATLPLSSRHRVSQILFHHSQPYVAVQSHDRSIEVFRMRTEDEVRKKQARRRKRAQEKEEKSKSKKKDIIDEAGGDELGANEVGLIDLFTPIWLFEQVGKSDRSTLLQMPLGIKQGSMSILLALASNALEVYNIPPPPKSKDQVPEASRIYSLDIPGHRTDVRTLCLSSDDQILASASNGTLKLWNVKTTACIRTIDCGYAICSTFLPGDRHLAVGTKSGDILVYDVASSTLIDTVKAHSSTVWSMHLRPDGKVLASGSADKEVKFWELEHEATPEDEGHLKKSLVLVHTRTLKMSDDVLSLRYSPNGKLVAVSLLDSTVKIFYQDTLKFFLSLYGHKLPVLAMDISDDSKLIVTCSADKNVKIWGLDFGDCHRSIFAHEDSVTQVLFEKKSHYFWTVGKDRVLKYWDGDKFENIQKLEGHHNEIWALAVSHYGNFVVTGSHDKSIRIWEKLDEPLFLEEERERELEHLYENDLAETLNQPDDTIGQGENADSRHSAEVATVSKQTMDTLMAGERIIEALDLADNERAALRDFEDQKARLGTLEAAGLQPPPRHPILAALDLEPDSYVLRVVERISRAALYDALLVLPFGKVLSLMPYLDMWAKKGWNIALVSYITFFLLKTHHHQIVANRIMRTTLIQMRIHLRNTLRHEKDTVGYNLAALQYLRRKSEVERTAHFFEKEDFDETKVREKISEGKKRKRVSIKA